MKVVKFTLAITNHEGEVSRYGNRAILLGAGEPQSLGGTTEKPVVEAKLHWDGTAITVQPREWAINQGVQIAIESVTVDDCAFGAGCTLWSTVQMMSDSESGISLARWEFTEADIDHLVRVASVVDANDLIASQFAANVEWYGDDVPRTCGDEMYVCTTGCWLQADTKYGNTRVETAWLTLFKLLDALMTGEPEVFVAHDNEDEAHLRELITKYVETSAA